MFMETFQRYRMEIDLRRRSYTPPVLPEGYFIEKWSPTLVDAHATAHYMSFRDEIDARLFENFRTYKGCRRVMESIMSKPNFLPDATWLIVYQPKGAYYPEYCATIQGLVSAGGCGAIQNVGVFPRHRGKGFGHILLHLALEGYQRFGLTRADLEVTACNERALHLYRSEGFQSVQLLSRVASTRR